jgi:hypothetical protein
MITISMITGCASKHRAANTEKPQGADYQRPKRAMGAKFCWLWPNFFDAFGLVAEERSDGSKDEVDVEGGLLAELYVDLVLNRYFSVGPFASLLYTNAHIDSDYNDSGEILINAFGGRLKGRFQLDKEFELRPSLSIGYSIFIDIPDHYTRHSSYGIHGFMFGLSLEGVYYFTESYWFLIDFGVFYIPIAYEGNESFDITFGPLLHLGLGIEFGS